MHSSHPRNHGYAFLVLMMMVTVLLISLTAALPSIYTAGQREKEAELIFRGTQYQRAIMLFHRQFGRYPSSIEEIVKRTNGIRFLRQPFPDPMSAKGKWRLIHVDARGTPLDSRTMPMAASPLNQNPQTNQNSQTPVAKPTGEKKEGDSSTSNEMLGGFIIGVASTSRKPSIRIWNNYNRYDQWEFMAVGAGLGGAMQGQPPVAPGPGGGPGGLPIVPGPGGGNQPDIPPLTDRPFPRP